MVVRIKMAKRRELEPKVKELRSEGKTYQEIEALLGINEKTARRWLKGVSVPLISPEGSIEAPGDVVHVSDREWPAEWTIDSLDDLRRFDRSRWEANLVIVEVAQRQGNVFLPWYFRRLVETASRYTEAPDKANPWLFSIAGLPVLGVWLNTPECMDLASLIGQIKPWESKKAQREYRKLAQPYVTAIEHGITRVMIFPPPSVDTQYPVEVLLRLVNAWVPTFDRAPLLARLGRLELGHLFLLLFRNPKPVYGGLNHGEQASSH